MADLSTKLRLRNGVQVPILGLGMSVLYSKRTGNALARVQRVHEPADLWDITFCTH